MYSSEIEEEETAPPALPAVTASLASLDTGDTSAELSPAPATTFRGGLSTCSNFQAMTFEPLPGAAQEIEAVRSLWNRRYGDDTPAATSVPSAGGPPAAQMTAR